MERAFGRQERARRCARSLIGAARAVAWGCSRERDRIGDEQQSGGAGAGVGAGDLDST